MTKKVKFEDKRGQRPAPDEPLGDEGSASCEAVPETAPAPVEAESAGPPDPGADLTAKVAELEDALLRAKADYQNAQRRATIERVEAIRFANAALVKSLLPVLDDLERGLTAADDAEETGPVVEGIRLVHQNLLKVLAEHGVEPIDALGQTFDPTVHEAMMRQPSADLPTGMILQEVAPGYRMHDRVLRPAKVIVAQNAGDAAAPVSEDNDSE